MLLLFTQILKPRRWICCRHIKRSKLHIQEPLAVLQSGDHISLQRLIKNIPTGKMNPSFRTNRPEKPELLLCPGICSLKGQHGSVHAGWPFERCLLSNITEEDDWKSIT